MPVKRKFARDQTEWECLRCSAVTSDRNIRGHRLPLCADCRAWKAARYGRIGYKDPPPPTEEDYKLARVRKVVERRIAAGKDPFELEFIWRIAEENDVPTLAVRQVIAKVRRQSHD
jgi:hypothetical protein